MEAIQIYNTQSKVKEPLELVEDRPVLIYSCGPTVYSRSTLGNLRTMVIYDLMVRTIRWLGHEIRWVMNYTDVGHLTSDADEGEDKIASQAAKEKKTAWEIASHNIDQFDLDMNALHVLSPEQSQDVKRVRATDKIAAMRELVLQLKAKNIIYKTSDGWYFDTSQFPRYGQLAKVDIAGLREGARVNKNPEKKNPTDFAVWKFSPSGVKRDMEWDDPIAGGKGFPGWHLECSAIIHSEFGGETIDLHLGGVDLAPTHHQNEIAQSEVAYEHPLAKYWAHIEHLMVDGQRMGKSEGNMLTIEDLKNKGFSPLDLRYFVCTAHYRSKLNFTWEALAAAKQARNRLSQIAYGQAEKIWETRNELVDQQLVEAVKESLANDFDFPGALALIWEKVKEGHTMSLPATVQVINEEVLMFLDKKPPRIKIPDEVKQLLAEREKARSQADFSHADQLRQQIEQSGYIIEDTKDGPKLNLK